MLWVHDVTVNGSDAVDLLQVNISTLFICTVGKKIICLSSLDFEDQGGVLDVLLLSFI
jgi:hypothetical protein